MAREPQYPEEGRIGQEGGTPAAAGSAAADPKPSESKRNKHLMAGAAIGIGSAAIVAALLYANRSRKGDKT